MISRTTVRIEPLNEHINIGDNIISLGSCFSAEIGSRMADIGYNICNNPFGVLYNPSSIANSIKMIASPSFLFTKEDIIERDPHYCSKKRENHKSPNAQHKQISTCPQGYTTFYHHGSSTKQGADEFLEYANNQLLNTRIIFEKSNWIFVTFGTAFIYKHKESGIVVSNCHKHLENEFSRHFLSVEDIFEEYSSIINQYSMNQNMERKKWIFTLSPIRHLKDGLHNNQLSKATLLLSIDKLCKRFDNVHYFPAYEIVLDELRDYTSYAEDMTHPSDETINYVWEHFRSFAL